MDTSSSQSKTSHLSSAMVNLYIHMGKLRNSFYEIKYTETFSVQMTHKNSQNDDNGDFITLVRSEEGIDCTCAYKIFWCSPFPCTSIQSLHGSAYVGMVVK